MYNLCKISLFKLGIRIANYIKAEILYQFTSSSKFPEIKHVIRFVTTSFDVEAGNN